MSTTGNTSHTHCIRCGRKLTARASVARQMGRGCRAIVRAAALAEALRGFTEAQADKARDLIADGGIVAIREGIYRVAASAGDAFYSVAVTGQCSCRAGVNGKQCYHWAAARVMAASTR
jgi:hypothetical protein